MLQQHLYEIKATQHELFSRCKVRFLRQIEMGENKTICNMHTNCMALMFAAWKISGMNALFFHSSTVSQPLRDSGATYYEININSWFSIRSQSIGQTNGIL